MALKLVQRTGEEHGKILTGVEVIVPTSAGHGPRAGIVAIITRPGDPNEVLFFSDGPIEVSLDE